MQEQRYLNGKSQHIPKAVREDEHTGHSELMLQRGWLRQTRGHKRTRGCSLSEQLGLVQPHHCAIEPNRQSISACWVSAFNIMVRRGIQTHSVPLRVGWTDEAVAEPEDEPGPLLAACALAIEAPTFAALMWLPFLSCLAISQNGAVLCEMEISLY